MSKEKIIIQEIMYQTGAVTLILPDRKRVKETHSMGWILTEDGWKPRRFPLK